MTMSKSKSASAPVEKSTFTNLPPAYIGKPALPIKPKTGKEPSFRRLPFVAGMRSKARSPYWNIPASGGHFGGYETGVAMALSMLKYMRDDDSESGPSITCPLAFIAESLMKRFEEEGGHEMSSRKMDDWSDSFHSFRGQYAGFFGTLRDWLIVAARSNLGRNLDNMTEELLIARANAGLGFNDKAFSERDEA
jgi:hypothetical protein